MWQVANAPTIVDNIGLCGVLTASRVLGAVGSRVELQVDKEWRAIYSLRHISGRGLYVLCLSFVSLVRPYPHSVILGADYTSSDKCCAPDRWPCLLVGPIGKHVGGTCWGSLSGFVATWHDW